MSDFVKFPIFYVAFIIGATHFTKRMPNEKIISICKEINYPIVLLGGNDVKANGDIIQTALGDKAYNACNITTLVISLNGNGKTLFISPNFN